MRGTPLVSELPAERVEILAALGHLRRLLAGTPIFFQGDAADEVCFLWKGRIELTTVSGDGARQLHTAIEPPQFFGELGPLSGSPRTVTAQALEPSIIWACDGEPFLRFVSGEPASARALLEGLARQVVAHEVLLDDLLFLDLKGRVAKRLLGLVSPSFDQLPADGAVLPSVVTHADLASLAGGSRENVTRILSQFRRRGIIERDGRRLVLRDVGALAKLAGL